MSDDTRTSATRPDDLLPPIKPPSGGYIVQLFVVPGLIVAGIAVCWLLVNSLVLGQTTDPRTLIQGLEKGGVTRWQTAHELANVLRDPRHDAVKSDPAMAKLLGDVLVRSVEAGDVDHDAVTMRYFVAQAIGTFHVDDGLPALLLAAKTGRGEKDIDARLAAIRAIALIASTMQEKDPSWAARQTELQSALNDLSADDADRVRSEVAFAAGVFEGDASKGILKRLIDDPYPDARYNAAIALASDGDLAALPILVEMLDPDETAGVALESDITARPLKRLDLIANAANAVVALSESNPDADMSAAIEQLERVSSADAALREKANLQPSAVNAAKVALNALK